LDELAVVTATAAVPCCGTTVAAAAATWHWQHVTDWILNITSAAPSAIQQWPWSLYWG